VHLFAPFVSETESDDLLLASSELLSLEAVATLDLELMRLDSLRTITCFLDFNFCLLEFELYG
jgi:hypothetical protein